MWAVKAMISAQSAILLTLSRRISCGAKVMEIMNTRESLLSRLDETVSRLYVVCADITDPGFMWARRTVKDVDQPTSP